MDQPLRILAILHLPWDPRFGAARVWIELTDELRKAGHVVEKFCLTDAFPEPTSSSVVAVMRLLFFPFHAARFVRRNAERFDVVDALIGTLPFTKKSLSFRGLMVARSVGLPRLYEKFERFAAKRWPAATKGKLLGRPFYSFYYWRTRVASEAAIRHCDLLNLLNAEELRCVREEIASNKPAITQPNGLSPAQHRALREAAAPKPARWAQKKIVFTGMWSPRKGAKDWGQIIEQIRARVPDACFLFLGTMVETQTIWHDLQFGPVDFVEVVPRFQPDELPHLLSNCTVAAFPSYVEGFGLAVVEQLAAGLPTIAYDVPGPRDIMRNGVPECLVPTGDVARFSGAIVQIFENGFDRYQELSDRSAKTALHFSWPAIAAETAAQYRNHLGKVASPGAAFSST
jgi:glycosyltransferase involved in cell wall biosynthesis